MARSVTPSRKYIMVGLLILAFILLDPFDFRPRRGVRRPDSDPELVREAAHYFEANHRSADDYVLDRLESDEVVILGELGQIRQHIEFAAGLVDRIALTGVRTIAFEHLLAEDQTRVDALLDGDREFDRREAADLFMRRHVLFGFEEYVDFLEAVHRYNAGRPAGSEPLRVVALAPRFHFEYIETRDDIDDLDIMRRVVGESPPDDFMAEVFRREVLDAGERALAVITLPHAFSDFVPAALVEEMEPLGYENPRPFGVILDEMTEGTVSTVLLHGPWPDEERPSNLNYAVDGHIDAILDEVPDTLRHAGFDLGDDPLGNLTVTVGQYGRDADSLRLRDLAGGYVTLGPIAAYASARSIPDFYTAENIEYARVNFPGPTEDEMTPEELQEFFGGQVEAFEGWIDEFR